MLVCCLASLSSLIISGFARKLPSKVDILFYFFSFLFLFSAFFFPDAPEHHELVGKEKTNETDSGDKGSSSSSDSSFDLSINGFKGIRQAFQVSPVFC